MPVLVAPGPVPDAPLGCVGGVCPHCWQRSWGARQGAGGWTWVGFLLHGELWQSFTHAWLCKSLFVWLTLRRKPHARLLEDVARKWWEIAPHILMDGLWRAEARDTVQCKMKRGGWDSTSNLSCHCISPRDDFPSLITVLLIFPRTSACSETAVASAAPRCGKDMWATWWMQQPLLTAGSLHCNGHSYLQLLFQPALEAGQEVFHPFDAGAQLWGTAVVPRNQCPCTTLPSTTRLQGLGTSTG